MDNKAVRITCAKGHDISDPKNRYVDRGRPSRKAQRCKVCMREKQRRRDEARRLLKQEEEDHESSSRW